MNDNLLVRSMSLVDLVQDTLHLSYLESLVVTALFIRGGYATMQLLEEQLGLTSVTMSAVINELRDKPRPLLRKNEERSPVPLVLLITPREFARQCQARYEKNFEKKMNYLEFLKTISRATDRTSVLEHLEQSFILLFDETPELGLILANLYVKDDCSIEKRVLYEKIQKKIEISWHRFNTLLAARTDVIRVHSFARKSFVQARFSLRQFTFYLQSMLSLQQKDFFYRLDLLMSLASRKYEDVIPYYYVGPAKKDSTSLAIAKELNRRLKLHLSHYNRVLVIWNGRYQGETRVLSVISREMTDEHQVFILTTQKLPKVFKPSQKISIREITPHQLPPDFRKYDILVFGKEGLYYSCFFLDQKEAFNDITPATINEVLEIFRGLDDGIFT